MITHLWKEWRDHRAVILGIVALLPPVIFAALLLIPAGMVALPTAGAAAGLAIAALALGADLVPGEIRRGTIMFLRRLPGGLGPVFAAKAILLLGALVLSGALGFGAANLAQRVAGRPALALDWTYAPEALAVVLWIFAVAMWLPRGELAVPATALCLGAFVLPMHLLLDANPGLKIPVSAMSVGRWALVPAALLVAWLSFRGRRFGGAWGSAWRGLLVTLLLFTPAWGYVANKASDWRHFDPHGSICICDAWIGTGGRYAFLNAAAVDSSGRHGPSHAILVDLESGDWRKVGDPRDCFRVSAWLPGSAQPVIAHVVEASDQSTREKRKVWENWYDGATGERFKSGWSDMRLEAVVARRRPSKFPPQIAAPPDVLAVLDDGAVIRIRDQRAIVRVKDGTEEQLFPR